MKAFRLWALGAVIVLAACGSDDPAGPGSGSEPGSGVAVQLKGVLAGGALSGDIDITIAATGTVTAIPVTGCVYANGATCGTVTGSYNFNTKVLTMTVASPSLTFTGTYAGGEIHGTYTGSDSGDFVVIQGTVTVYCGTFSGDASGTWNFAIHGSSLDGVYDDGGGTASLAGSVSGNNVSITFSGGTATGTLSGASANGTWAAGVDNGNWTGTSGNCRT